MRVRSTWGILLLTGALIPLASCSNNPELNSISVNPAAVTTCFCGGLQVEFIAIGSYTRPGHTPITKDITDQVTWSSSFQQMVTVTTTGVATVQGFGYGNGSIYAAAPGFHGDVVGSATFVVSPPTTSTSIRSLSLVQDPKASTAPDSTVQFTAMGKMEDGTLVKLPAQPKWTSTDSEVASIDQKSGLVSTLGTGRSTIVAVYTNPDGTTAVGVTHLNVNDVR